MSLGTEDRTFAKTMRGKYKVLVVLLSNFEMFSNCNTENELKLNLVEMRMFMSFLLKLFPSIHAFCSCVV